MLDKIDMKKEVRKQDYDDRMAHLEIRMGELQRQCIGIVGRTTYHRKNFPCVRFNDYNRSFLGAKGIARYLRKLYIQCCNNIIPRIFLSL